MFLALKELVHAKKKFALIIAVVVLVSYLVYFLTSLAYGLASSYTNAVNKLESDYVVMTKDANDNLMMSFMTDADFNNTDVNGDKAKLGLFPAVIKNPETDSDENDTRLNVYLFGIENESFIRPQDSNATLIDYQVIVSVELQKEGYALGDKIALSGYEEQFVIVGFTEKATYQTVPVIYVEITTWSKIRFNSDVTVPVYSGLIIRGLIESIDNSKLEVYTIDDYIFTLPGYTAQVLTFTIMIVFLIIIVAFVLGIFVYVLTIQKTSMFGVMKAQGISNFYIASSVLLQTVVLVAIGIAVGLILTEISIFFLKDIVPLATNLLFYVVITASFFIFALFGGLFSVNAVLKIDPLRAIGG